MAHKTPNSIYDRIDQLIARHFVPKDHQVVREMIAPFIEQDSCIATALLNMSRGHKGLLDYHIREVRQDFRDILCSVGGQDDAVLETPERIDRFQKGALQGFGIARDPELDERMNQLESERQSSVNRRPWWKFW